MHHRRSFQKFGEKAILKKVCMDFKIFFATKNSLFIHGVCELHLYCNVCSRLHMCNLLML